MPICYLGIGSNLGDRRKYIKKAVEKISKLPATKMIKVSKIRETQPQGRPAGQRRFFNAALKIKTNLPALTLLRKLKTIEKELGRKKSPRFGPRTIDLDILLYGNEVIRKKNLVIPHPRMFERKFVLKPLAEIL